VVGILDAHRPGTLRDPYGWDFLRTRDIRIADAKEAWIVPPIQVKSSRENSELIRGQQAMRRVSDQVSQGPLQHMHHART